MKKIMFSRTFGLEQSVLDGSKTHTRRFIYTPKKYKGVEDIMLEFYERRSSSTFSSCAVCDNIYAKRLGPAPLPYEVGEVVAVAQRYKDAFRHQAAFNVGVDEKGKQTTAGTTRGWNNKMFVKAKYMPHQIQINDLWFERLQDISDEDIMREGIHEGEFMNTWDRFYYDMWGDVPNHITFKTPREAFASLIDRINGRGTWESNPWVVVYEFELIK